MTNPPSTAGVKACYVNAAIFSTRNDRMDEFDNWLTEHTRQAKEQAWEEGYWLGINGHTGPGNPYQTPRTTDRSQE